MTIVSILLGIALLTAGGEALIRGALTLSAKLHISPLLSGLLIVGFGTSAPELAVSVDAALSGKPDLAVTNVIGSNIGNILLILGLCALITPLTTTMSALKRDASCMVGFTVLLIAMMYDQTLNRWDALILLTGLAIYLFVTYKAESTRPAAEALSVQESNEIQATPRSLGFGVLAVLIGLAMMIGGAKSLIHGATALAQSAGISQAAIGLTVVAIGTSLPELSVSIIAAIRRHTDVAIGNVLGSNIFNIAGILGISATLSPLAINPAFIRVDQWVMLGAAIALVLALVSGRRINRLEGGLLLAGYMAYCYYIWLKVDSY